jgi:hypothetical protein
VEPESWSNMDSDDKVFADSPAQRSFLECEY